MTNALVAVKFVYARAAVFAGGALAFVKIYKKNHNETSLESTSIMFQERRTFLSQWLVDTSVMFQHICHCRRKLIYFCGGGIEASLLLAPPRG